MSFSQTPGRWPAQLHDLSPNKRKIPDPSFTAFSAPRNARFSNSPRTPSMEALAGLLRVVFLDDLGGAPHRRGRRGQRRQQQQRQQHCDEVCACCAASDALAAPGVASLLDDLKDAQGCSVQEARATEIHRLAELLALANEPRRAAALFAPLCQALAASLDALVRAPAEQAVEGPQLALVTCGGLCRCVEHALAACMSGRRRASAAVTAAMQGLLPHLAAACSQLCPILVMRQRMPQQRRPRPLPPGVCTRQQRQTQESADAQQTTIWLLLIGERLLQLWLLLAATLQGPVLPAQTASAGPLAETAAPAAALAAAVLRFLQATGQRSNSRICVDPNCTLDCQQAAAVQSAMEAAAEVAEKLSAAIGREILTAGGLTDLTAQQRRLLGSDELLLLLSADLGCHVQALSKLLFGQAAASREASPCDTMFPDRARQSMWKMMQERHPHYERQAQQQQQGQGAGAGAVAVQPRHKQLLASSGLPNFDYMNKKGFGEQVAGSISAHATGEPWASSLSDVTPGDMLSALAEMLGGASALTPLETRSAILRGKAAVLQAVLMVRLEALPATAASSVCIPGQLRLPLLLALLEMLQLDRQLKHVAFVVDVLGLVLALCGRVDGFIMPLMTELASFATAHGRGWPGRGELAAGLLAQPRSRALTGFADCMLMLCVSTGLPDLTAAFLRDPVSSTLALEAALRFRATADQLRQQGPADETSGAAASRLDEGAVEHHAHRACFWVFAVTQELLARGRGAAGGGRSGRGPGSVIVGAALHSFNAATALTADVALQLCSLTMSCLKYAALWAAADGLRNKTEALEIAAQAVTNGTSLAANTAGRPACIAPAGADSAATPECCGTLQWLAVTARALHIAGRTLRQVLSASPQQLRALSSSAGPSVQLVNTTRTPAGLVDSFASGALMLHVLPWTSGGGGGSSTAPSRHQLRAQVRELQLELAGVACGMGLNATGLLPPGVPSASGRVMMPLAELLRQLRQGVPLATAERMESLGSAVCAVLPCGLFCKNPGCRSMDGFSEATLLQGGGGSTSSTCSGCQQTAACCSSECCVALQEAHGRACTAAAAGTAKQQA